MNHEKTSWKPNTVQLDFVRELSFLHESDPEEGYLDMPVCMALEYAVKSAKITNRFLEGQQNANYSI